jgi:acyl carrier protein
MNRFLESVSVVLEHDDVGFGTDFRSVPLWCSLQGFGLMVMMENEWNAPLSIDEFLAMRTVKDLFAAAFIALAAEVFSCARSSLSAETGIGSIAGWDSVNHLRLVMEAEKRFGVVFAMERIGEMKSLADFVDEATKEKQS